MYSALRPRDRFLVKGTLALAWGMVAAGGMSSIVYVDHELLTDIFGGIATTMSLIAMAGVIMNRYRWEWVAAWFTSAAVVPYALDSWRRAIENGPDNLPTAFLLTALIAFFALRALLCSAHAAKLRAIHTEYNRGDGDV